MLAEYVHDPPFFPPGPPRPLPPPIHRGLVDDVLFVADTCVMCRNCTSGPERSRWKPAEPARAAFASNEAAHDSSKAYADSLPDSCVKSVRGLCLQVRAKISRIILPNLSSHVTSSLARLPPSQTRPPWTSPRFERCALWPVLLSCACVPDPCLSRASSASSLWLCMEPFARSWPCCLWCELLFVQ